MTSLPSGLASISARLDDIPQVRGAVDMAKRLRRAEALSKLAEMDAPLMCSEGVNYEPLGSAIDRHAALAVSAAYRSADRR
ncbi:hypothetical protein [Methylorubrum extorquens]|uniref:Uncharacterized protein n=1 Tax=Methylorubrum extorquens (strain ATCC 14718 / DSM 1338 / JCM 2805 / NCIMB 9133 / AM1) TaxID=272630 RepID=C5B0S7_METEA|nr:hypothetical protein [Methylorubrum extorquens]ACS41664.1 Hypothetical protein MexAM1_META1p3984 [Methylorubrum extorquens AM1]MCP1545322.1 hypothetical protein [Methylorubrum extorquens]MCP1587331.1 hypothetical protein [Methylorubrum extorquens]